MVHCGSRIVVRHCIALVDIVTIFSPYLLRISHVSQALRNFLHAYKAHVNTYNELQQADKYSSASKAQSVYFARKLSNRLFMEFAIYMLLDVLSALSAFSKVSQERNVSCGTDSLQKALTRLLWEDTCKMKNQMSLFQ